MFLSNRIVYLELHKTGCTHIGKVLDNILDGKFVGKHNHATPDLFLSNKVFLGSVRDPWEWYTSLWAYGCDGRGGLFRNVTRKWMDIRGLDSRKDFYPYFIESLLRQSRNPQAWRDTYTNSNDAEAFRKWIRMVHDKTYMLDIREGYGTSSIGKVAGLMTFRYLKLFCTKLGEQRNLNRLSTIEQIMDYENDHCFIDHFIRNEALVADLFRGLEKYGIEIPSDAKTLALSIPKTNTSSRKHGPMYFYDQETENLVSEREHLIIEKFGYVAPSCKMPETSAPN